MGLAYVLDASRLIRTHENGTVILRPDQTTISCSIVHPVVSDAQSHVHKLCDDWAHHWNTPDQSPVRQGNSVRAHLLEPAQLLTDI